VLWVQPETTLTPADSWIPRDHFIPQLGVQTSMSDDGTHVLRLDLGERVADVGLVALLADMAGGHTILTAREPCHVATTHLEVHGIGNLVGPGEIVATSRLLGSSKRRGVIETLFQLGDGHALSHSTFAVRDGDLLAAAMPTRPRVAPSMTALWQTIGVVQEDAGATLELGPHVGNHTGALQGGATIALAEAAALLQLTDGEQLDAVSIHYLHTVRGHVATATARRHGSAITVDICADAATKELARLTFSLR